VIRPPVAAGAAVCVAAAGMVLVVAGVLIAGLFLPGVVLIGLSMIGFAAAGVLAMMDAESAAE
jgi:hypothetical protein